MAYPDKFKNRNFFSSILHALAGIIHTANQESNFKYELMMALFVTFVGLLFQIRSWEWIALILCIGLVLASELINTAIENTVDLFAGNQYYDLAKQAKDAAAGAVLVISIMASIIGLLIFVPYFWALLP